MTTFTASSLIALAKTQVGYKETRDAAGEWTNGEKYAAAVPGLAWANHQPWCATFMSWLATESGAAARMPITASCDAAGAWYKARGEWHTSPAIGDQVFFGTSGDLDHTGLVISFTATTVSVLAGNTNTDGSREGYEVAIVVYDRHSSWVQGYGRPKYEAEPGHAKPTKTGDATTVKPVKVTAPKPIKPTKPVKAKKELVVHEVVAGDTLISIAAAAHISLRRLRKLNPAIAAYFAEHHKYPTIYAGETKVRVK